MEEVMVMFKPFRRKKKPVKPVKYYKPNIGALRGPIGMSIVETIRNAKKPDLSQLEKECEEREKRIMAAIENGTF